VEQRERRILNAVAFHGWHSSDFILAATLVTDRAMAAVLP